jgi:hypothetical protein
LTILKSITTFCNISTSKMFFLKIPIWIWALINLKFGIIFLYDLQL